MTIVVRTLSDRVLDIVREQIITGRIAEDVSIRQDALAAELGVSKIPLREALARLEQEGLLFSLANRGYFVRPMTLGEAEEIYEHRLNIEPRAAALGSLAADNGDRAEARAALHRLEAATGGDPAEIATCHREFHLALVRPGGRELTTRLAEQLAVLAERYVLAHLEPHGRDERALGEHRGLLEAWLGGDAEAVAARCETHLRSTLADLRDQLKPGAA